MNTHLLNRTSNIVGSSKFLILGTIVMLGTLPGIQGVAVASDDAVVINATAPTAQPVSLDDQATNACFNAFLAKVLPGSMARVRNTIQSGERPVLSARNNSVLLVVTMEARSAHDNTLLASARCTATNSATVRHLSTVVADPAKLAGLTPKGISLAAVMR